MKNNLKYLTLLFATFFFISCEEEIAIYDPAIPYAQFLSTSSESMTEASSTLSLVVGLGAGSNADGFTTNFTVTSSDDTRFTISPSDGTLYFGPGIFETSIDITPIDNTDIDGDATIEISLSANDGVGGEGNFNISRSITVIDDDCPTIFATDYAYEGYNPSYGGLMDSGTVTPTFLADNVLYLDTGWGYGFIAATYGVASYANRYLNAVILEVAPDGSVTGEDQYGYPLSGIYVACSDTFTYNWPSGGPFARTGSDIYTVLTGK
tara:strand:- start:4180 stop:4974 length:795 start_codon:yes stop_codon:yes gene_type:complete